MIQIFQTMIWRSLGTVRQVNVDNDSRLSSSDESISFTVDFIHLMCSTISRLSTRHEVLDITVHVR